MAKESLIIVEIVPNSEVQKSTKRAKRLKFKKGQRTQIREKGVFPKGTVKEAVEVVLTRTGSKKGWKEYDAGVPGLDFGYGYGKSPHEALVSMGEVITLFQNDLLPGDAVGPGLKVAKALFNAKLNPPRSSRK